MSQQLLLGDEALAQGALNAGLSGCYAYPGTPSTEIMEYVARSGLAAERGVHREWSCNEKVALEEALGMSYSGRRSMVCMKHVGLNVAGDGFMNSAITGTGGGMLVVVADDPSMHSSQNEQDSRYYGQFAMIPCLEPSSQQEAYDVPAYAFRLSESMRTPVLVRLTTRLSHSRANVEVQEEAAPQNELAAPGDPRRFVLLPGIARRNYRLHCEKQPEFLRLSNESPWNRYFEGGDHRLGIIATGIAFNYVQEAFGQRCPHPLLKIGQYPLPDRLLRRLFDECGRIAVFEEGMPFVEGQLRGPLGDDRILGRLSGETPRTGELSPRLVAQALGLPVPEIPPDSPLLLGRPPRLCDGCPHIDSYEALNLAKARFPGCKVFGDIGCYTLGALPPFSSIDSCIDMGASVSMAKGASDAGLRPAVAVVGDSTFTHSGMTGVLDAVWERTPVTILILDNYTTGMTGGQDSLGSGKLEDICAGLGVEKDHIRIITPLRRNLEENAAVIAEEIAYQGVSVVISRRECIQTLRRKRK